MQKPNLQHHKPHPMHQQSVLQDMFAMIMMVDISDLNVEFTVLADRMTKLGEELGLSIHTMHEDIFDAMHRI